MGGNWRCFGRWVHNAFLIFYNKPAKTEFVVHWRPMGKALFLLTPPIMTPRDLLVFMICMPFVYMLQDVLPLSTCSSVRRCARQWDVVLRCARLQEYFLSRLESKDSWLHIQFCVEKQCGQRCEVKGTWQVGKDLQMKKTNNSVFWNNGDPKLTVSTIVNSWKRHQNPANTNEFASHVNLRSSQNPGRVAKVRNDMLEKRWNGAGSLRAAWPCFTQKSSPKGIAWNFVGYPLVI